MLTARIILLLLATQLISVATVGAAVADRPSGAGVDAVAAKVNGRAIYINQLKPNVDKELAKYRKYGASNMSAATKSRLQKQELDREVGVELLAQAGEKLIGKKAEAKVDERIKAKHAADAKSEHTLKTLDKDLKNAEYRKQVRRQLFIDEYLEKQGLPELRATEAEAKKYYEENQPSFKVAESLKVSHILIRLPKDAKEAEVAKAREEMVRIRQEAVSGKSFSELATKHSACASAPAGGNLGYITRGYMPREFDTVAFALKEGEMSDVVRTRHGFHIIKAADKKPERIQEFVEVKDLIEKFLVKKIQADKIDEIVRNLKRDAKVEIFTN